MAAAKRSHANEASRRFESPVLAVEKPLRSFFTGSWLRDTVLAQVTRLQPWLESAAVALRSSVGAIGWLWTLSCYEKVLIERRVNRLRHSL